MMRAAVWLCCCAMAMGASAYQLEVGETGIMFRTQLDDRPQPLLAGVGYRANDDDIKSGPEGGYCDGRRPGNRPRHRPGPWQGGSGRDGRRQDGR